MNITSSNQLRDMKLTINRSVGPYDTLTLFDFSESDSKIKSVPNVNVGVNNRVKKHSAKSEIYNLDYIDLVKLLKQKQAVVDAIITDPPYNVSRNHQLGYSNMGRSGMDYGEWDYGFDQTTWILESVDLVKEGGSIIIFNDWKNLGLIARILEKHGFLVKDIIRWIKKNPMPRNTDRRYVNDCEFAIWAVKDGAKWTFNKPSEMGYLRPEIVTGVVPGGKQRLHPTQKHLDVMDQLIKVHTNVGDTVLDPFLGSGTTAVACVRNGRNIIGSEIDKKYYDITLQRLADD